MREPEILEIALPKVTVADVFHAEGVDYGKRPPQPSTVNLHRRMLAEATRLVRPTAIWTEVDITGVGVGELHIEDGHKLTSKLLAKAAGTAEKLLLFTATIGTAFEDRLSEYKQARRIAEAYALDSAGTAYVTQTSTVAVCKLKEIYRREGLNTTFPMGPGHSYWKGLEDMRAIFHFLSAERIGLHLNNSNIIMPFKSVAMVMGVGCSLPDFKGKTHCNFCSLQTSCQLSQRGLV